MNAETVDADENCIRGLFHCSVISVGSLYVNVCTHLNGEAESNWNIFTLCLFVYSPFQNKNILTLDVKWGEKVDTPLHLFCCGDYIIFPGSKILAISDFSCCLIH